MRLLSQAHNLNPEKFMFKKTIIVLGAIGAMSLASIASKLHAHELVVVDTSQDATPPQAHLLCEDAMPGNVIEFVLSPSDQDMQFVLPETVQFYTNGYSENAPTASGITALLTFESKATAALTASTMRRINYTNQRYAPARLNAQYRVMYNKANQCRGSNTYF
jgi:hypothetical protein